MAPPEPPQLPYPARGTGLGTPTFTTELASRAGLSAAAVSQHLTALRDAGLM
ncbi:ArsR family transcriptional regulator [Streptomyces sp. NPDC005931]|uniref:ArsR family transcriptional regulator n=1 Tax=Streptomyces sp. NPDC005931 TaxID=3364737 RepID=UPI0036AF85D6